MAKQVLPVNFTDDLLAESMDGKRKYRIIDNGDGTVSLEDVSEYLQMGSAFGAGQINSTNQAVNESVDKDKILKTLEEVSASTDGDAVVGRGAVAELNKNMGGCVFSSDANGAYVTYEVNGSSVKKKLGSPEVKLFACKRVSPGYKETITIPETGDFTLVVTNGENWGGNSLAVTSATVDYTIEDEYHTANSADAYSSLRLKLKAKAKDTITIQYGVTSGDYLFTTYVMF